MIHICLFIYLIMIFNEVINTYDPTTQNKILDCNLHLILAHQPSLRLLRIVLFIC